MAKKYKKLDTDTLETTVIPDEVISTISRAEIQTKIDHKEIDKARIQLDIDELNAQIAILDA